MSYLDLTKPRSLSRPIPERLRQAFDLDLMVDDFICDKNPLEYLGLDGAASDPNPRHLFGEALALYNTANTTYLSGPHDNPSLLLESAKRSCRHQALLYVRWFWWKHTGGSGEGVGPQKEANAPGKSLHEYGFAIDVIRGREARRIQTILRAAGWLDGIEAEGWHFEAVQAPAHASLLALIEQHAMQLSDKYKSLVSDFLYTRQACRGLMPDFLRERSRLQVDIDRMQRQKDALDREKVRLASVKRTLDADANAVMRKRDLAVRHRREYANMRYTLCENGEPEETCIHYDLVRLYRRQKEQARVAVEAEEREVRRLTADLNTRVRVYDAAVLTHNNNVAAWERYKIDWERRNRAYVDLKARIERMDDNLRELGQKATEALTAIETTVTSIIRRL